MPGGEGLDTRKGVREDYHHYATRGGEGGNNIDAEGRAESWGYDETLRAALGGLPREKEEELFARACGGGCPLKLGLPLEGQVVVDLGCGAGHDCCIASKLVGPTGHVIGVDMTEGMLQCAAANAQMCNVESTVQFCEGVLDDERHLEGVVAESTADVVMSNGAINLCVDKAAAFATAYRLCKPGGRFQLFDVMVCAPASA